MNRNASLVLLVVAVAGALVWLAVRSGVIDSHGSGVGRDEATRDATALPGEGTSGGATPRATTKDRGPVLFGRPRELRVGTGAVVGRIGNAKTGEPVKDAKVLLAGSGFGDEPIALRATSVADGGFQIPGVPAGDEMVLKVEAEGLPTRTLPGVAVNDGSSTGLGTIWLGAKATLEGRVVDEQGRPVAHAKVRVHVGQFSMGEMMSSFFDMLGQLDREPEPVARAESHADGRFEVPGLDPGAVTLVTLAPGFAIRSMPVTVLEGGTKAEPVTVRLATGGVVAGHVVDAEGRGLGGVRVAVLHGNDPSAFLFGRTFQETGADGAFQVTTATLDGDLMVLAAGSGFPTAFARAHAGQQDVQIVMQHGATVLVRVVRGEREIPVENAQVMLATGDDENGPGEVPKGIVLGVTDPGGRVTFDVAPGAIEMVMISHADGGGMWMPGLSGMGNAAGIEGPKDTKIVAGTQEKTFRLGKAVVVTGRVTGPEGEPVPGARVMSIQSFQMAKAAVTDADGRYRLVVPDLGVVSLVVKAQGYVQDAKGISGLGSSGDPAPKPGPDGEIVRDIRLERGAVVTGRVVDPHGAPIAGAQVRFEATSARFDILNVLGGDDGLTGADGRYVLEGAPPSDEARVVARRDGWLDSQSDAFAVASGRSAHAPDVVMRGGARLLVTVEDADGRSVEGAQVRVEVAMDERVVYDAMNAWQPFASEATDRAGQARFETIAPGHATITATHPDAAGVSQRIEVPKDVRDLPPVTLALRRAVAVEGRVTNPSGQGVAGASLLAEVVVASNDGAKNSAAARAPVPVPASATTDAEGRFRLYPLAEEDVSIRVSASGFRATREAVHAPASRVEIRLEAVDPRSTERLKELQQRMGEIWQEYQSADAEEKRQALMKEIQALSTEMQKLQQESGAADAAVAPDEVLDTPPDAEVPENPDASGGSGGPPPPGR